MRMWKNGLQLCALLSVLLSSWFILSCSTEPVVPKDPIPNTRFRASNAFPNQPNVQYKKKYRFTKNMFRQRTQLFMQAMGKYRGKPDVHYLEIGVHEGRALLWVLENILTHPSSTLTGVDLFDAGTDKFKPVQSYGDPTDFRRTFFDNIKISGHRKRIYSYIGYSQVELKKLQSNAYDIIYIDGCHTLECVQEDAKQSWRLLKEGGRIIFDDYSSKDFLGVYNAANAFYVQNKDSIKVIHKGRILVLEKAKK